MLSLSAPHARRVVAVFVLGGGARRAEALRSLVMKLYEFLSIVCLPFLFLTCSIGIQRS